MPAAMIPAIWAFLGVLSYILQLVGVLGVIAGAVLGLISITDIIMEVAEGNEDHF